MIYPYPDALTTYHKPYKHKTRTKPPRRVSTRGGRGTATAASRRRTTGGIRKNARNRQPRNRYGQGPETPVGSPHTDPPSEPPSSSKAIQPSTLQYTHSSASNNERLSSHTLMPEATTPRLGTQIMSSPGEASVASRSISDIPINISTMWELLRSHEQEIVDRVVLHLGTINPGFMGPSPTSPQAASNLSHTTQAGQIHPGINRIVELERQLEELPHQMRVPTNQSPQRNLRVPSVSTPIYTQLPSIGESASGIADSVEILFPASAKIINCVQGIWGI